MSNFKIYSSFSGKEWPLEEILQDGAYFGPGWKNLVKHLINDLFILGWKGHLAQVKEKFGGLRFYADGLTEEMDKLITAAEEKSIHICDECGLEGRIVSDGWLRTLCPLCEIPWRAWRLGSYRIQAEMSNKANPVGVIKENVTKEKK